MDIFNDDIKVSIYNGKYDNIGVVLPLRTFLNSTRHKEQILQARKIADKKQRDAIKVTMPMAIVGGVCQGSRKAKNTIPNGLIAIDMDAKDNPGVDWETLKFDLGKFAPQIAYCSLSFSGNGLFAIIPIKYPRHFTQHFEQLLIDFSNVGIVLDKSCRDISRTRSLSYDEHPYINHNAVPYERLHIEPKKPIPLTPVRYDATDTEKKVALLVDRIKNARLDLTRTYDEYLHIGMALADLGEAGRQYFHDVCQFWEKNGRHYNPNDVDKDFNNFLRTTRDVHIGTFFTICHNAGIYLHNPQEPHRIEPQQPIAPKVEQLPTQAEKVPVIEEKRAKEQPYHIPDEPHLQQMIANNPAIGDLCTKLQMEVVRVDEHPRQYPHIHFDPMAGIDDEPVDLSSEWERVMSQPILQECPF